MRAKALVMCACCLALAGCGNQDNPVQTVVARPVNGSALQAGTDGGRPIGQDNAPVAGRRRYVAFESRAANLTANDTNGVTDVFVHDNDSKQTVRVSVSSSGIQGNGGSFSPVLTPDGRVVVFESLAANLAPEDTNRQRTSLSMFGMEALPPVCRWTAAATKPTISVKLRTSAPTAATSCSNPSRRIWCRATPTE